LPTLLHADWLPGEGSPASPRSWPADSRSGGGPHAFNRLRLRRLTHLIPGPPPPRRACRERRGA
jgi:hypothetical protein